MQHCSKVVRIPTESTFNDEVTPVLNALHEARIKYAIWGAAACHFHGWRWLWKSQDYEILINDWFDGPSIRLAIDAITAGCFDTWEYDADFDYVAWAAARGDHPPTRQYHRFRHASHAAGIGVILIPGAHLHALSMHRNDLIYDEDNAVWIYPNLKSYVEGQLGLWNREQRNSALVELADVAGCRKLHMGWADEVGLDVMRERMPMTPDRPSEWEMFEEIARMVLTNGNRQYATARFAARRAEKEAVRQAETQAQIQVGGSEAIDATQPRI